MGEKCFFGYSDLYLIGILEFVRRDSCEGFLFVEDEREGFVIFGFRFWFCFFFVDFGFVGL